MFPDLPFLLAFFNSTAILAPVWIRHCSCLKHKILAHVWVIEECNGCLSIMLPLFCPVIPRLWFGLILYGIAGSAKYGMGCFIIFAQKYTIALVLVCKSLAVNRKWNLLHLVIVGRDV